MTYEKQIEHLFKCDSSIETDMTALVRLAKAQHEAIKLVRSTLEGDQTVRIKMLLERIDHILDEL